MHSETKADINQSTLPTFHQNGVYEPNILQNIKNALRMKNPSDITFIMDKNHYLLLTKHMIKIGEEMTLRTSNESIYSYKYGYGKNIYWSLNTDSLLYEPFMYALSRLAVRKPIFSVSMLILLQNSNQEFQTILKQFNYLLI